MVSGVGLGWVVSEVVLSGLPNQIEVALLDAVLDPMVAHVDRFASSDLSGALGNAAGGIIIVSDCCWPLWVTEISEGLPVHFSVLGVEVQ